VKNSFWGVLIVALCVAYSGLNAFASKVDVSKDIVIFAFLVILFFILVAAISWFALKRPSDENKNPIVEGKSDDQQYSEDFGRRGPH
jgi:ABC-type uncharacterized transport system permease subunit